MAQQRRVYRVAEKIREIISRNLLRVGDERFHMVTISAATVSPDLRHAKIYWYATAGKERLQEVEEAFEQTAHILKKALAAELNTRFVPAIRFYYDETLDAADEIEVLLAKARAKEAKGA